MEQVQQLVEAIGVRAKQDYIDALIGIRKGKLTVHSRPCVALIAEIEDWVRMMFDDEMAEEVIAGLRAMGPSSTEGRAGAHKQWW